MSNLAKVIANYSVEEQEALYRAMAQDKLLFAKGCMSHIVKDIPDYQREMYTVFNEQMDRQYKYSAMVLFRSAAKSTISKTISVTHDICFAKERFVLLISESQTQAYYDLVNIQDEIESNDIIQGLFGLTKGAVWNQFGCELSNGIYVAPKGYGSRIRGVKWKNMRPSKICLDDFESEANSKTVEQRDEVSRWLTAQVFPCGDPDSIYQFLGTIVHHDAFLAKAKENLFFQPPLGRYIEVGIEKNGVPSWEKRYPMEWINDTREYFKSQGRLAEFLQEYYNVPILTGTAVFDYEAVKKMEGEFQRHGNITFIVSGGKKIPCNVFIGVDPARTISDKADDTAIVVVGVLPDNTKVLIDVFADKVLPSKQVEIVSALIDKYRPRHAEVEVNAYQFALVDWLRTRMAEGRCIGAPLVEYTSKGAKGEKYITGLEPIVNSGNLMYLSSCNAFEKVREELRRYSGSKNDDDNILDGLFLSLDKAYKPHDYNVDDFINNQKQTKKRKKTWITI